MYVIKNLPVRNMCLLSNLQNALNTPLLSLSFKITAHSVILLLVLCDVLQMIF